MEQANTEMLAALDELPGTPWPSPLGGVVASPLALAVLGDLTDSGRAEQMRCFERSTMPNPTPAVVPPLYPATMITATSARGIPAPDRLARPLLRAWDWGEVRVLCMDTGPTDSALVWLARELAGVPAERPLMIFQHFAARPVFRAGLVRSNRKPLYPALAEHRVLAIFHGHFMVPATIAGRASMFAHGSPCHLGRGPCRAPHP